MSLLSLVFSLTLVGETGLSISGPFPLKPKNARFEDQTVIFETPKVVCRLTAWEFPRLMRHLGEMGVKSGAHFDDRIRNLLANVVAFEIRFENKGENTLIFNPEQVLLVGEKRGGPVGLKLEMADLWPTSLPEATSEQEALARLFARGTLEVQPGRSVNQLLVFRTVGSKPFPKSVVLQANRLFYGIQNYDFHCRYEIRYPKE